MNAEQIKLLPYRIEYIKKCLSKTNENCFIITSKVSILGVKEKETKTFLNL